MNSSTCNINEIQKIKHIENRYKGKSYIASKVLINISATLFGLKAATLMNITNLTKKPMLDLWEKYGKEIYLGPHIENFELKRTDHNVIVLFYERCKLEKIIYDKKNINFLRKFGYSEQMSIEEMLQHLKSRYSNCCPHEIGIFLGIPLKDVLGYMGLTSAPCTFCGCWKVYGDPEKSKRIFRAFKRAREKVIQLLLSREDPFKILFAKRSWVHVHKEVCGMEQSF